MHKLNWNRVVLLILACSTAAHAVEFHVAPSGSDTSDGSADRPFATLVQARTAAREVIARGLTEDVAVLVHRGTYRLDSPFVLGPEDSGTPQHAVVYKAAKGTRPTITGGIEVAGFESSGNDRWTATVPQGPSGPSRSRQLFADGQRLPRARFPNAPELLRVKAVDEKVLHITFEQPLTPGNLAGQGAELVVYQNWSISRAIVKSSDANSVTAATPVGWIGHGDMTTTSPGKPAYLENALAFLDQPGEWYLDTATGRLAYQARPGEDPNRRRFVVPVAEQLLLVRGDAGRPVRNLRIEGIVFEYTEWPLPAIGYSGIQAGHYGPSTREGVFVLPAAIEFQYAVDCRISDCRVLHTGAGGIALGPGCRQNRIVGCEVADIGGNGIMVGRRTPQVLAGAGDSSLAADWGSPKDVPVSNEVINCVVQRCGAVNHGCVGIYDGFCERTRIAHNIVTDMPYTGISVGFFWGNAATSQKGCVVEYNHIFDVMKMLADGGGIYTLGRQPGSVLRGNHIHGVHRSPYAHGGAPNNGVFFDEGTCEFLVEGNVIYDTIGESVRFNQCTREQQKWADNVFDVKPDAPSFPKEKANRAGLEEEYRGLWERRLQ